MLDSSLCLNREITFELPEIFYSRTDKRGVIRSGNQVFYRVSGYGPDQLIGAPHRIVRHPDMPRGVFWLMWDRLERGLPVVAYVKNRAQDGRYYWVIALVRPIQDGYLSVRFKPGSELFHTVQGVYAELLEAETNPEVTPETSAQNLLERLAQAGFADYDAFMAHAVRGEMQARLEKGYGLEHDYLREFDTICALLSELNQDQENLVQVFEELYLLPINLRIISARQESAGGPVSAVSEAYRSAAGEIAEQLRNMRTQEDEGGDAHDLQYTLNRAMIDVASALLQAEYGTAFDDEAPIEGQDKEAEAAILAGISRDADRSVRLRLADLVDSVQDLTQSCHQLRAEITRLDQIRVMGEVESRRSGVSDDLSVLMQQLRHFHADINKRLSHMIATSDKLQRKARRCSV